jgi:hypothetical protein
MPHEKLLAALPLAALFAAVMMMHSPAHAAGQEGLVVVRDPQTGQFRAPTPAEMKALAPAAPALGMRTVPQAAIVTNPNGTRSVRLGEASQVYEVVHRAPDGKLVQQCVQGEQGAERALAQPATHEEPRHEDR